MILVFIVIVLLFIAWANGPSSSSPVVRTPASVRRPTVANPVMPKKVARPSPAPIPAPVIRSTPGKPDWFCTPGIEPSPAEQLIINELNKYRVDWFREVSFQGFQSSRWGYYRYDFYIPTYNLVIEYDSKLHHEDPERIRIDGIKTAFCWGHGITIKRFTNKDYYVFPTVIEKLMKAHSIRKK